MGRQTLDQNKHRLLRVHTSSRSRTFPGAKRRVIAISAASVLLLIAVSRFVALYEPAAPTTFIESLSAAQRKEIPILLRKEGRRRGFLLLKRRQFKAAWRELRASNAQVVVAVGYEPQTPTKSGYTLGDKPHSAFSRARSPAPTQ